MNAVIRKPSDSEVRALGVLVESMPDAFTPQGRRFLVWDAERHDVLVAELHGAVRGFIVWVSCATEIEILWLAVDRSFRRRGIATALVDEVVESAGSQRVVISKTAYPEQLPCRTELTQQNFRGTIAFFEKMGFNVAARAPDYWGCGNSVVFLVKRIWHGHE